jgi:peroxiredoxin
MIFCSSNQEVEKMELTNLPNNLPVPIDDGACNHLLGYSIPSVTLKSHKGNFINLAQFKGWLVVYFYPMTGRPDVALPDGWDQIPGARGCTPQSCSFRNHYKELQSLGAEVFGISCQSSEYQAEAAERLHLPFELLSDENFELSFALRLPLLDANGKRLIKRITLIAKAGKVEKVFYPVFPPDKNAEDVIAWLSDQIS